MFEKWIWRFCLKNGFDVFVWKMDLALNNPQMLILHKTKTTNQHIQSPASSCFLTGLIRPTSQRRATGPQVQCPRRPLLRQPASPSVRLSCGGWNFRYYVFSGRPHILFQLIHVIYFTQVHVLRMKFLTDGSLKGQYLTELFDAEITL